MIRILLVDDQKLIRQGLQLLLERNPNLHVVGSAHNGQTAIEQVEALQPDVALVDICMPGMDGVTTTQIISQRFAGTKVIVLSSHDDKGYLINALHSGARGYLLKDTPAEELINAIHSVHQGYTLIGPGLLEKITLEIAAVSSVNSDPVSSKSPVLQSLELEIERQLNNFTPEALPELVYLAVKQKVVAELLAYKNNLLERNLNNPAALYLVGALKTHSSREDHSLALHYLKLGFQEGIKQGLASEELVLFYQVGVSLEASEAFSWLTQVNSPWNNEEGLSFLLQEASRLFGNTSTQYRALLVLRQLKAIQVFSDSCIALSRKAEFLQQVFK